ncbi:MAG: putative short-subunit dehydrogenase-like oxidoreductase (DUF2520 family) [Gammaproteobacteria bacterium]|jgi:predicted short-subunit dehydrogenase-like oxidoreductase (DUF2520 family)
MSEASTSVCLLGAGAVAHALAHDLTQAGWDVRAWARRPERAPAPWIDLDQLEGVQLILICVSDGAIAEVAQRVHRAVGSRGASGVALHTSGYHDARVLDVMADDGWSTGSFHPLCAVPPLGGSDDSEPRTVAGSWFACEGDERAQASCARLLTGLSGQRFPLPTDADAKGRYHAAATLVAAGSVALLDAALSAMGAAEDEADRDLQRRAFADLARGALENAAHVGATAALTGPHARGDASVVAAHIELLRSTEGAPADLYREITRRVAEMVRRRGALSQQQLAELDRTLE